MTAVLRAGDEPEATRADYWQQIADNMLCPLELQTPDGIAEHDQVRTAELGPIRITQAASPNRYMATRSPRHIRRSDPGLVKIDLVTAGQCVVQQDDREACLRPGDIGFVDLSRPCRWASTEGHVTAVIFPRATLGLSEKALTQLTAVRIRRDQAATAMLSSLAQELPNQVDAYADSSKPRVGAALLDLIAATLAAWIDQADLVPQHRRHNALTLRVKAHIEQNLDDTELSPSGIAAAHYISTRRLYQLFETEHVTVAGWIRRQRLERCRRDLQDPAQSNRPVSAIGRRWGFTDAAHFSRTFRSTYGAPPTVYRRSAGL